MKHSFFILVAAGLLAGCTGVVSGPQAADGAMPVVHPSRDDSRQAHAFSTYLSARFAAGQHDLRQAAAYYGDTLALDPTNPSLLALSFFYASTAGEMDKAGDYARAVVAKDTDDRAARLALAVIALKKKDYKQARTDLASSAEGPFTQLTVSLLDAWTAAAQGDDAAVEKDLTSLRAQNGAEGLADFHAALLHDFMGQTKTAAADYQKIIKQPAVTPRALEAYGRFLERNGQSDAAATLYKTHLADQGLATVTMPGLERIKKHIRPDSMIRSAQDGVAEALFGIAASLSSTRSADVSILYLRMALYLRPDLDLANILLADRFEDLGKYDDAIAIYQAIPKDSPYYRMAAVQTALDQQRKGDGAAAVAGLKTLVASDSNDTEAWTALGDAYRADNKYAEAVQAYDKAVAGLGKPGKQDWTLFYARAMAKERLGQLDSSEADVETGLKLSPNQPELLNYLGYSWVDRGHHIPEALAMLKKARTLRPYDGYIVDSVGWAYYKLGDYKEAAKTLEAAVLLVPGDPTINDHYGDALWRAGRRIEARFQWNHALAFSDEETDKAAIEAKIKSGLAHQPT